MEFADQGGGTVDLRRLSASGVLSHRLCDGEVPNVERRCLEEEMWLPYLRVAQKWVQHTSRDAELDELGFPVAEDLRYRYEEDHGGYKMVMRLLDIMFVLLVFE